MPCILEEPVFLLADQIIQIRLGRFIRQFPAVLIKHTDHALNFFRLRCRHTEHSSLYTVRLPKGILQRLRTFFAPGQIIFVFCHCPTVLQIQNLIQAFHFCLNTVAVFCRYRCNARTGGIPIKHITGVKVYIRRICNRILIRHLHFKKLILRCLCLLDFVGQLLGFHCNSIFI